MGRILTVVFGWAVIALFGETSRTTKMWLSALVGAAAAWPVAAAPQSERLGGLE